MAPHVTGPHVNRQIFPRNFFLELTESIGWAILGSAAPMRGGAPLPLNILPTQPLLTCKARVLKLGSSRSGAVVRGVARGTVGSIMFNLQPKHRSVQRTVM